MLNTVVGRDSHLSGVFKEEGSLICGEDREDFLMSTFSVKLEFSVQVQVSFCNCEHDDHAFSVVISF